MGRGRKERGRREGEREGGREEKGEKREEGQGEGEVGGPQEGQRIATELGVIGEYNKHKSPVGLQRC